jgi:hypothetical protein
MLRASCRFPPFVDDDGTGFDIGEFLKQTLACTTCLARLRSSYDFRRSRHWHSPHADLWNATWYALKARVTGNAVKEAIVGESPPEIEFLPVNQMLDKIRADELDVAMCGIYGSQDLYHSMDFGPVYHSTEVGTLVQMPALPMEKDEVVRFAVSIRGLLSWPGKGTANSSLPVGASQGLLLVLKAAFSNLDSWAVFSFIVLLYFTMVFAHIFWIIERNHNPMVNRHYGDGVWKGMYFGMVTGTGPSFSLNAECVVRIRAARFISHLNDPVSSLYAPNQRQLLVTATLFRCASILHPQADTRLTCFRALGFNFDR